MNRVEVDAFIKKNIGTITLVGGIAGLIPFLMMSDKLNSMPYLWDLLGWLSLFKPSIEFGFYSVDFFYNFHFLYELGYFYLPIIFFVMMIVSYFSLKNQSQMGSQLIRFSFSIIFISQIMALLWIISSFLAGEVFYHFGFRFLLSILFNIGWGYVAFTVLRSKIEPVDEFGEISTPSATVLNDVPNGSRLIHHIVDSILYIGICSGIITFYGESMIYAIQYETGSSNFAYLIVAVISRLMYYPVFETLFGTTPGKFLTGSKVVGQDGGKINLSTSISRTFSRMVPFEPFSFLGKGKGWHDAWTKTRVVFNEEENNEFGSDDVIDDF